MYMFQFPAAIFSDGTNPSVELPTMDLGVGSEGLIGRKVQLVDIEGTSPGSPRILCEGILGWN
jgi:hypothetical protein